MPPSTRTARRTTARSGPGKKKRRRKASQPKLSRLKKPEGLPLEDWQTALRRQYGREQDFRLENVGDHPVFSEFQVTNPKSRSTYLVSIRGTELGDNHCSCPDFATNTLGTCKHIEFALGKLERKRGGKRMLSERYQPPFSEVYLHYGSSREVRFRPGAECPQQLSRLAARYFDDEGVLRPDAYSGFEVFLSKGAKLGHELECRDDVLSFVAEVRDVERRRQLVDKAFPRGIKSAAFNKLLKLPLYDYQREGALFAARAGRTLLGDEMGLGKTMQAIAAAEIMAQQFGVERVLVVCPTSLKHQWEREIERACKRSAMVIGGLRTQRADGFRDESFFKIMNYDTVHTDLDLIHDWSPDLVLLDEAQRIKNWDTRTARSVKKIESPYAIVLTGTPLENRLEELVSIVQFIDQHRLGPTFRLMHEHQIRDETGRVVGYQALDQVGRTLEPILVRRRKTEVLSQLPKRLEKNFFVPMMPLQQQFHTENMELVARVVQKWRRYGFLSEADQRRLMIGLQNMRMSCDSSYLLDQQTDEGVKAEELATLLGEVFEQPDTKVVIFSQWVRMHELVTRRFNDRRWDHVFFHGGVASNKRKALVDRFREDPDCRAFLATDAGGVGLNLQHAHVVVNMDLPWNPAVLEQRIGRVHRLGQTRPVQVVNFVAQGTIEEGMLGVLKFKKSLFAGVLDGGEKEVFLGGSRLNRFMETVEKVTTRIPEVAPETPPADLEEPASNGDRPRGPKRSTTGDSASTGTAATTAPAATTPAIDPLAGLLQNGLALLEQLAGAASAKKSGASGGGGPSPISVERDPRSGQSQLKITLPEPEVVERALDGIRGLLETLRK